MNRFYEGLAEILEVSVSEIGPNFALAAHGWDSLAIISCISCISCIALIDEVFGQLVAGSVLAQSCTVGDLERLVTPSIAA